MFSFSVRVPSPEFALEVALIRRYKLLDARVVPHFAAPLEQLVHLGLAAAQFFCELLREQKSLTVGIGSGYEVRAMVESLSLPNILNRFQKLQRLEFWGLSESPMPAITQGLSTQIILTSIALRCDSLSTKTQVRCHHFNPNLPYLNLDAAIFRIRQPYEGDPTFLESVGIKCIKYVKGRRPVAFMLNQFLDDQGKPILPNGETKCVPVEVLQTLVSQGKPIVALNARAFEEIGPHAEALRIACANNIVNCLIIPRPIAEAILRV